MTPRTTRDITSGAAEALSIHHRRSTSHALDVPEGPLLDVSLPPSPHKTRGQWSTIHVKSSSACAPSRNPPSLRVLRLSRLHKRVPLDGSPARKFSHIISKPSQPASLASHASARSTPSRQFLPDHVSRPLSHQDLSGTIGLTPTGTEKRIPARAPSPPPTTRLLARRGTR